MLNIVIYIKRRINQDSKFINNLLNYYINVKIQRK
jgi:hypothetical protein